MLMLFGLDHKKVIAEIEQVKKEREDIEQNYDAKVAGFKDLWKQWVMKYKQILSKQKQSDEERQTKMNKVNPAFILRTYLMQEAIEKAEKNSDFSMVNELLELAKKPFDEPANKMMTANPPKEAFAMCVSCSS